MTPPWQEYQKDEKDESGGMCRSHYAVVTGMFFIRYSAMIHLYGTEITRELFWIRESKHTIQSSFLPVQSILFFPLSEIVEF